MQYYYSNTVIPWKKILKWFILKLYSCLIGLCDLKYNVKNISSMSIKIFNKKAGILFSKKIINTFESQKQTRQLSIARKAPICWLTLQVKCHSLWESEKQELSWGRRQQPYYFNHHLLIGSRQPQGSARAESWNEELVQWLNPRHSNMKCRHLNWQAKHLPK